MLKWGPDDVEPVSQSLSSLIFLILISALSVFLVYRVFKRLRSATATPGGLEIRVEEY